MNILFVLSGNRRNGMSPIIENQANSLLKLNKSVSIDYFQIRGKGIHNYLKYSLRLRKEINRKEYDLIHAHYLFSGADVSGLRETD